MAFEKINQFVDEIAAMYRAAEKDSKYSIEGRIYLQTLVIYDTTVLNTAKFKYQKKYLKSVLFDLNKSYAEGYYKLKKSKH